MKLDRRFWNSIRLVMSFRVGYQSVDVTGKIVITHQFVHLFWAHLAARLNMETARILSRQMSGGLGVVGHLSQSGRMQQSIQAWVIIAAGASARAKLVLKDDQRAAGSRGPLRFRAGLERLWLLVPV